MSSGTRPPKKNKERLIGFRVDDDAFNEIENRAVLAGKSRNDWCRDELLARLAEDVPLTANEELIHAEIIRYGNLLVKFVSAFMKNELTPESANQALAYLHQDRRQLSRQYFARIRKELREEGE
jgi:hypothetical protein